MVSVTIDHFLEQRVFTIPLFFSSIAGGYLDQPDSGRNVDHRHISLYGSHGITTLQRTTLRRKCKIFRRFPRNHAP